MVDELVRRLGCAMGLNVGRAGHQLRVDRPDAPCDQVRIRKVANPNRTIETLGNEVDEAVAVAGLDMELGMTPRQFRKHRGKVGRAKGQRRGHPQSATQGAGGQDGFLGDLYFGADPGGVVPECRPGFRQRCPAGSARKQLDTQFRLKPGKPAADDRLGHPQPHRRSGHPCGIGDFNEGLQLFDIQISVPRSATQQASGCYYCSGRGNSTILLPGDVAAGAFPGEPNHSQHQ